MNREYTRAPHRRAPGAADEYSPHAALLIDFDNVTMTIRSNLGVEVRRLLDSDMIRGKVSVQRAYADWRRYPQYVLALSEASIDLIYAPAYGSSKKNATDIRLAIDALELVFTRPEIGTFILLSGDSDFSSLVLKLKEYGKYVIGVGLQESSSDILVQNCDEYYSYNTISGLTSAVDAQTDKLDPWELTDRALERMVERKDVMRSDRLKQVMLEMDATFDEKSQGFSKFNKFLAEAARRELVSLRKSENGQYEVSPGARSRAVAGRDPAASTRPRLSQEVEPPSPRRRSRSRSREERGSREARGPREERDGGPSGRADARPEAPEEKREEARQEQEDARPDVGARPSTSALRRAYDLLRSAIRSLAEGQDPVRDSEVKRQILAEDGEFDEAALGFRKFSRFLQQAHDEGVIDLTQGEDGNYYLTVPGEDGARAGRPTNGGRRESGERARRSSSRSEARGRDAGRPPEAEPVSMPDAPEAETAASTAAAAAAESRGARPADASESGAAAEREERAEPAASEPRGRRGLGRFRRGSRGSDPAQAGPAPAMGPVDLEVDPESSPEEEATVSEPAVSEPESSSRADTEAGLRSRTRRGVGRFRRGSRAGGTPASPSGAGTPGASAPAAAADHADSAGTQERTTGTQETTTGSEEPLAKPVGGSEGAASAVEHMVRNYSGVGQRTAERLVEEFGDRVFDVIDREPQRVTDLLSEHRARAVLEAREAERETGSAPNG